MAVPPEFWMRIGAQSSLNSHSVIARLDRAIQ
jgi:hypothetical protein